VHTQVFTREAVLLVGATIMLVMAVGGSVAGKLPGRFGEVSSRAKNPGQYWSALAIYYLTGIGFLGYYLYKMHAF
jgi:hypothetical protein